MFDKPLILVAGGAGYIGSHVTVELVEAGYEVLNGDNFSNCDRTCYEGVKQILGRDVPLVEIDFCDRTATDNLFATYPIAAVIHFAAFKAVGESVTEPLKYYRNNLLSLLNVVESAERHGCRNILFSSSATVYGEAEVQPVTEQSPRLLATSAYGQTKQMSEDILRDVVASKGLVRGIALRYFNPIGAHPSALIGELPRGVPNNLVPYITQTAVGKRQMLSIFGGDYPTPDGTCLRDFIDVVDLARAHVAAVTRMVEDKMEQPYEIFNVGTGKPVSVMQLVEAFERVNGLKLNYKIVDRRPGDIVAIWADTSLAEEKLGWKATRTLDETLASAWAWECHLAEQK